MQVLGLFFLREIVRRIQSATNYSRANWRKVRDSRQTSRVMTTETNELVGQGCFDERVACQLARKLVRDLRQTSRVATNESLPTGENTLEKTGQGLNLQQTSRGTTNESLPPGKLVTNRVATNASRQPTQVEQVRWGEAPQIWRKRKRKCITRKPRKRN